MDKKVIDFTNKDQLSEVFFIGMFGSIVQSILKAMFGNISIPVTIKGSPGQIQSFANVLGKEKKSILFIVPSDNREFSLAGRNIADISISNSDNINIYDCISNKYIIMDKEAVMKM